jgi:EpsI family protein
MRTYWAAASMLTLGAAITVGVDLQRTMPLRDSLAAQVPGAIDTFSGADLALSDEERLAVGVTDYLLRSYRAERSDTAAFSVYVGYYDRQAQGRTIHSPKNCLPGAGWEALASSAVTIETTEGAATVNRYLIRKGQQRALVLYWYQGRGRVEHNEYRVKWNLLRDGALRHRTEEALVRVVVPVTETEDHAFALASRVVKIVLPAVQRAVPA